MTSGSIIVEFELVKHEEGRNLRNASSQIRNAVGLRNILMVEQSTHVYIVTLVASIECSHISHQTRITENYNCQYFLVFLAERNLLLFFKVFVFLLKS